MIKKKTKKESVFNVYYDGHNFTAGWRYFLVGALALSGLALGTVEVISAGVRDIQFPIKGAYQPFGDSYGEPRSGGRTHLGTDILADKMTELVAVTDGTITFAPVSEPSWGYAIYLRDSEGYEYRYLHLNNDTPGTDDGQGGVQYAYAPGIERGVSVKRGQHIAYVGDSGNAESVGSHLHLELWTPSGESINSYPSLIAVENPGRFDPTTETELSQSIDEDKGLSVPPLGTNPCPLGKLIKTAGSDAVYYCGNDGLRYVFPNAKVYLSWYDDFSQVITVAKQDLATLFIGGNVTYKPGTRLVKIQTDPKVYAVGQGGTLRWIVSDEIATKLYGANWVDLLEDVPDIFFTNYRIGEPITSAG